MLFYIQYTLLEDWIIIPKRVVDDLHYFLELLTGKVPIHSLNFMVDLLRLFYVYIRLAAYADVRIICLQAQ